MFDKRNVQNIYALTPIQESMLFSGLYDDTSLAYFEQIAYHIQGPLDVTLFTEAWNILITRHDVLRTLFVYKNVPQPLQVVLKKRPLKLHFEDLSQLSDHEQTVVWQNYKQADQQQHFDVSKDILMRLAIFQRNTASFEVVWSLHHILLDGWSVGILYDELFTIYAALINKASYQLPNAIPFSQYISWLNQQDNAESNHYWQVYLQGYQQITTLPRLTFPPDNQHFIPEKFEFEFDATLSNALKQCAQQQQVTLNTVLQMLWGILLAEYNNSSDVVFASTVSGRPTEIVGVETIVGLFINTIPVRVRCVQPTFAMLLADIQQQALIGKAYHHASLTDIQRMTPLKQHLFDHILIFENYPDLAASAVLPGFEIDQSEQFELTSFDFSLQIYPTDDIKFTAIYNPKVFEYHIIQQLNPHLTYLAQQLVSDINQLISDVKVLDAAQQQAYQAAQSCLNMATHGNVVNHQRSTAYAVAETEQQKQLLTLWQSVLDIEQIGIDDNFFELGGHSLLAARIVARLPKLCAAEIGLGEFFAHPNIRALDDLINNKKQSSQSEIPVLPDQADYPLSFAQKRFWVLDKMLQDFVAYNQSMGFIWQGICHPEILQQALQLIVERHEILRTCFIEVDGVPRQQILEQGNIWLETDDISSEQNVMQVATQLAQQQAQQPFDLQQAELLRVKLITLGAQRYLLLLNMHHIICDGWSLQLFESEMALAYQALLNQETPNLAKLTLQYRDYAGWQIAATNTPQWQDHQRYWLKQLSGELPVLDLVLDYPRQNVQFQGAECQHVLNPIRVKQLQQFCQTHQVSQFMVLLTLVNILLYRYSQQTDLIIGSPVAGRCHPDLENQLGVFVNTLAWRTKIKENDNFLQLLQTIKQTVVDSFSHQAYPFDALVDNLAITRDISHSPVFDVMLVLQEKSAESPWQATDISVFEYDTGLGQFDLTFNVIPLANDQLQIRLNYNTGLFSATRMVQLLAHFQNLFDAALQTPTTQLNALPLLKPKAEKDLLALGCGEQQTYPQQTIPQRFSAQAKRYAQHLAIDYIDAQLTYQQLDALANGVADQLQQQIDITAETVIGVMLPRGQWLVVSLLGIMKTGAVYLPIDPDYPAQRIRYIVEDSQCQCMLTDHAIECSITQMDVTSIQPQTEIKPALCQPGDVAYMIYTSGSTGKPKGVMIEHMSFLNMIQAQIASFSITDQDRVLQFASPAFDASLSEIFMALLAGATLTPISKTVIADNLQFLDYLAQYQISVATLPPAYLHQLPKQPFKTLKTLITAGEPAIVDDVQYYARQLRYFNAYGPTETSVCATLVEIDETMLTHHKIPLGHAVPNTQIVLLDDCFNPVPMGVVGEICVLGAGLARGYWQRPELTAEKFQIWNGQRLYHTGDQGYWDISGQLQFVGRCDDQIKIRGQRLELGEIEALLIQYAGVQSAVVVYANQQLIAYYVKQDQTIIDEQALFAYLQQYLPIYMLPNHLIELAVLPLTAHGKVDRQALPSPEISSNVAYVAARTELEQQIVTLWQSVLSHDTIGIHDNFFSLGGHSLAAVQMLNQLQTLLQQTLPLALLYQYQTPAQLAQYLQQQTSSISKQTLVVMRAQGDKSALVLLPGEGGHAFCFYPLLSYLDTDRPIYALQTPGLNAGETPLTSVEAIAKHHLNTLSALKLTQPITLVGHSVGGWVAYEMAHQLEQGGQSALSLVLLDSMVPTNQPSVTSSVDRQWVKELEQSLGITAGSQQYDQLLKVVEANQQLAYQPQVLDNTLTFFLKAEQVLMGDYNWDWQTSVNKLIKVLSVPGDHDSMLSEPHVAMLAQVLNTHILVK